MGLPTGDGLNRSIPKMGQDGRGDLGFYEGALVKVNEEKTVPH